MPQLKTQLIEYDYTGMKENPNEELQGTEATASHEPLSTDGQVTAQPDSYGETTTTLPETSDGNPSETEAPLEDGFTREALDAGYMFVEAIHDAAEEELSTGWDWFGTSNTEELGAATTDSTLTPTTSKPEKRRRKKQRKRRGKKKKRVWKPSPGVGGHVECTNVGVKLNNAPP